MSYQNIFMRGWQINCYNITRPFFIRPYCNKTELCPYIRLLYRDQPPDVSTRDQYVWFDYAIQHIDLNFSNNQKVESWHNHILPPSVALRLWRIWHTV